MRKIDGQIELAIYTTEAGYVALKQETESGRDDVVCLVSVDQLPDVIAELQDLYANRRAWAEPTPE
jgi:hypothetical protein